MAGEVARVQGCRQGGGSPDRCCGGARMMRKLCGLTVLVGLLSAWAASAQSIYGSVYLGADGQSTLYTISPTTGAGTAIGPIGFQAVGSLAFAPNGTLYGIVNTDFGGRGNAQLLTINTTTGAGTVV